MADLIFPGDAPDGELGGNRLPDNLDLVIWQGDSQRFVIRLTNEDDSPIDLTGYTAQATIRQNFDSPTAYDFECTIQNGNEVDVYMSSADAELVPAGSLVWNFQITDINGDVRTYLAGDVVVYAQVD